MLYTEIAFVCALAYRKPLNIQPVITAHRCMLCQEKQESKTESYKFTCSSLYRVPHPFPHGPLYVCMTIIG
jgi:hypothetical protein